MGSVELLQNGLVKPENTDRFLGHIYHEASRLMLLIHVSGERCILLGIRGLVYEIVQNLRNNAVKYNVDGGTGLGLSIVKHAVQYHNARPNLQSVPGEGTAITVIFLKEACV